MTSGAQTIRNFSSLIACIDQKVVYDGRFQQNLVLTRIYNSLGLVVVKKLQQVRQSISSKTTCQAN